MEPYWCHRWWWFANWEHHRLAHDDHLHNALGERNCPLLIIPPQGCLSSSDVTPPANHCHFSGAFLIRSWPGTDWLVSGEGTTALDITSILHPVKLLTLTVLHQLTVLLNFTTILPTLSIWVFRVDYGVVRKSTLQKSHYSLILGAWGWPSRDPISPLPTESILLRWSIQHCQWTKKKFKSRKNLFTSLCVPFATNQLEFILELDIVLFSFFSFSFLIFMVLVWDRNPHTCS